jgi:hypothetical protein
MRYTQIIPGRFTAQKHWPCIKDIYLPVVCKHTIEQITGQENDSPQLVRLLQQQAMDTGQNKPIIIVRITCTRKANTQIEVAINGIVLLVMKHNSRT